nr:type IIL restriction-modification enzyme MmeI [Lactimicrobium massiliense]
MGFMSPNIISSDAVVLVDHATLYEFGILSSNVHNAWMRTVCGRLKADYRYAPSVYYNFPMPPQTQEMTELISKTAKGILDARKLYPDKTLADMYGKQMYLYPELVKAHQNNDRAVMNAYGFSVKDTSEADCVAELMKMYQKMVDTEKGGNTK